MTAEACEWCGSSHTCDCEERADCPRAGEIGHQLCGRRDDGTPRFVPPRVRERTAEELRADPTVSTPPRRREVT